MLDVREIKSLLDAEAARQGRSVYSLLSELGMGHAAIYSIINGTLSDPMSLRASSVVAIARALHVDPGDFLCFLAGGRGIDEASGLVDDLDAKGRVEVLGLLNRLSLRPVPEDGAGREAGEN